LDRSPGYNRAVVLGATSRFAVSRWDASSEAPGPRHREATSVGQLDTLGMARPAP